MNCENCGGYLQVTSFFPFCSPKCEREHAGLEWETGEK